MASSADFRGAEAVPNDFGGADVQYFERFGIAVVREQFDQVQAMLAPAIDDRMVANTRPERRFRALGMPGDGAMPALAAPDDSIDRAYLRGYRDAVNELAERLLGMTDGDAPGAVEAAAADASVTWGVRTIKAAQSRLSGAGIKVAILDTGFDHRHPDFRGRRIVKKLFATRSSPDDTHGHGTHCVGTACGPLKPSSGPRYGVAHGADIYAGKVLGDDGFGTDRSIIAGMDWAVAEGCAVISMSLGAQVGLGESPNDDYEQIGQACLDAGSLVVAAAGNESERPGRIAPIGSPANCPAILAVGAVDAAYRPARFSCGGLNTGQEVDLAAPGVNIHSAAPGGGYATMSGTSMATPHVAGIAALIAECDPKYRGWALWARLLQLVKPLRSPPRDVGKGFAQAPL